MGSYNEELGLPDMVIRHDVTFYTNIFIGILLFFIIIGLLGLIILNSRLFS